ncbi:hypothetical protein JTE90_002276 [Oedothorax gibbosus]|uniref:Secreted protein n=1 Tax=Oedothorax gibbosus TaxID=931172 RepID=A0AAV6UGG7_9ARAC|nr:hypothetical protein JTE90_002276 [Oedothorax gibbosus]
MGSLISSGPALLWPCGCKSVLRIGRVHGRHTPNRNRVLDSVFICREFYRGIGRPFGHGDDLSAIQPSCCSVWCFSRI